MNRRHQSEENPERFSHLPDAADCPVCRTSLSETGGRIRCSGCAREFPRLGGIPVLVDQPEGYLESCRKQVAWLESQTEALVAEIVSQLQSNDVLPETIARGHGLMAALREQSAGICSLISEHLPRQPGADTVAQGVPAIVHHVQNIYRDWGWPTDPMGENEVTAAHFENLLNGSRPGSTLVIGAGACRLAYDIAVHHDGSTVLALDLDPFLLSAGEIVIRGGELELCEANAEVGEMAQLSARWKLRAPHGPLPHDRIQLMIADGIEPPLAAESFDTVVTPWFIDVVPEDLRDFISTVYRLLKPGGQWLNLGPLRYPPEIPIALRFGREEILSLLKRAGLEPLRWEQATQPYLVSRLNGRGRQEWVLEFAAMKQPHPDVSAAANGPPAWLLFRHLPIPPAAPVGDDGALSRLIFSAIDGTHTLDDITQLIAPHARSSGLSLRQMRSAVRQCIARSHPLCAGRS